jgi:hypothetical protein
MAFDGLIDSWHEEFTGYLSMELHEDPGCIACMKRETREVLRSGMFVVVSMALDVLIMRSLRVCKSMGFRRRLGPMHMEKAQRKQSYVNNDSICIWLLNTLSIWHIYGLLYCKYQTEVLYPDLKLHCKLHQCP